MDSACSMHDTEVHTTFRYRKPKGKRPARQPRHRWVDIRMDYTRWEGVDWIHLAGDGDHSQDLVNPVLNLKVQQNFLSSEMTQLHSWLLRLAMHTCDKAVPARGTSASRQWNISLHSVNYPRYPLDMSCVGPNAGPDPVKKKSFLTQNRTPVNPIRSLYRCGYTGSQYTPWYKNEVPANNWRKLPHYILYKSSFTAICNNTQPYIQPPHTNYTYEIMCVKQIIILN
jgi:hypothetical protein